MTEEKAEYNTETQEAKTTGRRGFIFERMTWKTNFNFIHRVTK